MASEKQKVACPDGTYEVPDNGIEGRQCKLQFGEPRLGIVWDFGACNLSIVLNRCRVESRLHAFGILVS